MQHLSLGNDVLQSDPMITIKNCVNQRRFKSKTFKQISTKTRLSQRKHTSSFVETGYDYYNKSIIKTCKKNCALTPDNLNAELPMQRLKY